jgi:hypothetical protein
MTLFATLQYRFTQTDPLNCGAGCSAESAYVYVGSNPSVYVDPSGLSRSGVQTMGTNPVAQAGQQSAPEWLLKKSKQVFSTAWNSWVCPGFG